MQITFNRFVSLGHHARPTGNILRLEEIQLPSEAEFSTLGMIQNVRNQELPRTKAASTPWKIVIMGCCVQATLKPR